MVVKMKLDEYRKQLARDPEYLAAQEELRPLLELADTVLSQRLSRDWSQAELAERVGTRQANISRLESGLSNPSVKFLQRLADALDARLIIHLEPRAFPLPPAPISTAGLGAQDVEAILVTDWPHRASIDESRWNDTAYASSLQEVIS